MTQRKCQQGLDRMLRRKEVLRVSGKGATALWQDIKAGTFPKPRKIGPRSVGWLESEITNWLETREVA